MSSPATIGELIRERRLARGYSLGQLATQLRRTPAEVRRWERGEGLPADELVPALARALDVEVDGIEALRPAPEPTVEADAATEPPNLEFAEPAPESGGDAPPDPFALAAPIATRPGEFSDAGATGASAEADLDNAGAEDDDGEDAPRRAGGFVPATASTVAVTSPEPPTEPIAAPVATLAPPVAEAATAEPDRLGRIPNPLELLFDPHRRWLYWIRYALTVVVLVVLLRIFLWAAGELWEALGQFIDTFRSTDEVDALRLFTGV